MTNYLEMLILRHTPTHLLYFIAHVIDNNEFFCDTDIAQHDDTSIFLRFKNNKHSFV